MEKSIRLNTDIVVKRKLVNGVWKIEVAETMNTWWQKAKHQIYDIRRNKNLAKTFPELESWYQSL